ncbi:MAG: hypothetical protein Q9213_007698 [Squamulea squamosa]
MYTTSTIAFGISLLATLSHSQRIDKPAIRANLDYLKDGLFQNFQSVGHTFRPWDNQGWIPQYCLDASQSQDNGFNPDDITTYEITYNDCNTAWVVCIHKDSIMSIDTLADLFGRVPAGSRSFIRHILSIPDKNGNAGNAGDNIVLKQIGDDGLEVFLHEVSHSLDAHAYDEPASASDHWKDELSKDSAVPDDYSKSNLAEDFCQSSVIAAYNAVVPGGFPPIEPRWQEIRHQYETVQTIQREQAGSILVPGGQCRQRLPNSEVVQKPSAKRLLRGRWFRRASTKPDVSLGEGIKRIEPIDFDVGRCGDDIDSAAWGAPRQY